MSHTAQLLWQGIKPHCSMHPELSGTVIKKGLQRRPFLLAECSAPGITDLNNGAEQAAFSSQSGSVGGRGERAGEKSDEVCDLGVFDEPL